MVEQRHRRTVIGRGLGAALLALTLAAALTACGMSVIPPTPTEPPRTGPLGLTSDPLITVGTLQARAIYTYGQNGWLHITERVTHDVDRAPYATLPDGAVVPPDHVVDTWANITGPDKVITQRVTFLRREDGTVLQTAAFSDGVAWNSSTGQRESQTSIPVGAFDRGFGASVGEYVRVGATVTQALGTLDGAPVIQISVDNPFQDTSQYEDYAQPVAGQHITADYDVNGGNLRRLEWIMRLADGSQRRFGEWHITLEANATPTDEVLEALQAVQ
ncbi:MAG: hypothetical protein IT317_14990 [Anaerolineales bacterium]|nr:hypothetical protein [Anaerolineales bacterium]